MNVSFKYLEILRAVVISGSISKATRLTGLSQPSISQQMAKFEEELGTQLLYRRRVEHVELTPAGEFWFRTATDLLHHRDQAASQHLDSFRSNQMILHFGTTPSLRGSFLEAAARIAVEQGAFSRFNFIWGATSDVIVDMMHMHQINCGIVSAASVESHGSLLHVEPLFRDRMLWVVPRSIPDSVVTEVLLTGQVSDPDHNALNFWVEVSNGVPWRSRSSNWYRANLPGAKPFFETMAHHASVDIVAGGLATCHCPGSLIPNLSDHVRERIKIYHLGEFIQEVVFVMPRNLLSISPYNDFQKELCRHVQQTYIDSEIISDSKNFQEIPTSGGRTIGQTLGSCLTGQSDPEYNVLARPMNHSCTPPYLSNSAVEVACA
jgi:DNA-binding transcriptional LysR family regulator